MPSPNETDTADLLHACIGKRVLVLGDVMLDAYTHGDLKRISPEAPVPVLDVTREEQKLGGAANAAKCVVALGGEASVVGLVGDDPDAAAFRHLADALPLYAAGLVTDPARPTTRKTRIVARHQQVIRVDREVARPVEGDVEQRLIAAVRAAVEHADALLISDYGKGAITPAVARAAIDAANAAGIPSLIDPKAVPWDHFAGCTVLKPNRGETAWFTGQPITTEADAINAGRAMIERLHTQHAVITRSEDGVTWVSRDTHGTVVTRLPGDLIDPTGCGDVVAATLLLCLAAGADVPTATFVANTAAAVKATKFGAYAVTDQEILDAVGVARTSSERKILSPDDAAAFAEQCRAAGQRVVFTNGCFDLPHLGHTQYLERSRDLGDALIVGLNCDASIQRLKGPTRPVQPEYDRARNLAAREAVDAVVLFGQDGDDTPLQLLAAIKPDVLTKGGDYTDKTQVVGWQQVEAHGGRIELIDHVEGRSTTRTIQQMNE